MRQYRHRVAPYFQPGEIERDRAQGARDTIDDVPGGDVVRMAARLHQNLLFARPQVEHRDLMPGPRAENQLGDAADRRENAEEDCLAAWQDLRPPVVRLSLLRIRRRQHFRCATSSRHAQETRCRVIRRKDNRVVRAPARPAGARPTGPVAPTKPQSVTAGPPFTVTFFKVLLERSKSRPSSRPAT